MFLVVDSPVDKTPRLPVDKYAVDSIHKEEGMSTRKTDETMKWEEWAEKNTDPSAVRRKPEALDGTIVLDLSYGNRDRAMVPAGVYRCVDGFAAISAPEDSQFRGLAKAMHRDDLACDPRYATLEARLVEENADALHEILKAWAMTKTIEDLEELGRVQGFGSAGVKNAKDHYHSEHLRERGSVWKVDDPIYGEVVEYGPVPKMSESPGRIKWAAKPVGWDNERVLSEVLGYDHSEIRQLEQEGIVGKWADVPGRKPPEGLKG